MEVDIKTLSLNNKNKEINVVKTSWVFLNSLFVLNVVLIKAYNYYQICYTQDMNNFPHALL